MKITLLIADDSTLVRNNLKRLLNPIEALEIIESRDTDSTITSLTNDTPHIILLDLRMPNGSGFDVLRFIRTLKTKPIVIILTNSSTEESRQRCMNEGADFFFDKSKQHKEAVDEIKKVVTAFSRKGPADE